MQADTATGGTGSGGVGAGGGSGGVAGGMRPAPNAGAGGGVADAGQQAGSGGSGGAGIAGTGAGSGGGSSATPDAGASDAGLEPSAAGRDPDPAFLVPPSGPCPEFVAGYVTFVADGVERRVLLYIGEEAETLDGPLILSWHSTLPSPEDATVWLGDDVIDEITAQGGLVAAPTTADRSARRPWDNTALGPRNTDNDQLLMDEIVACARQEVGIDVRHIHATGMSAGGLKTAQVSLRRSGYLASVVVYSGGLYEGDEPPDQDPSNHFAAMVLYGGASDFSPVDFSSYTDNTARYVTLLRATGRFAFVCNHGGGHSVPSDSQASAWRFMQDHPFGAAPEPYAGGLPDGFPEYCSLDNP